MARRQRRKLSKKEEKALKKAPPTSSPSQSPVSAQPATVTVTLPATITVAELARRAGRTPAEVVGALLRNGVIASMNDSVDRETVEIIADELYLKVEEESLTITPKQREAVEATDLAPRSPVVVVLGHVDHGKTTLLDAIRETSVAAGESGGITQHIGAYRVEWKADDDTTRPITFLDTPGHEAFSAMRAHGVTLTDIAILVVAADDGVKPQTKEALSHARAASVPVIVAITKMDKPEANVDRVKGQLAELGISSEDWGGKTPVVALSAKSREGLDELLDTILLVADITELKARAQGPAEATVIEAHKAAGIGPVATVLVRNGMLRVGDNVVIGTVYGRVRLLQDERSQRHQSVGPATPIQVAGLSGVPSFGATLEVVDSEKAARDAARRAGLSRQRVGETVAVGDQQTLPIVLKADVDGSLKAIEQAIENLVIENVTLQLVHTGIGDLSESDVHLGLASNALLVVFRAGVNPNARRIAQAQGVDPLEFSVIYDLLEAIRVAALKAQRKELVSIEIGRLKVLATFHATKKSKIVGGRIEQGRIATKSAVRIERDGEEVGQGRISSLQRGQTPVQELQSGEDCGLSVETTTDIIVGDVLVIEAQEERLVSASEDDASDELPVENQAA